MLVIPVEYRVVILKMFKVGGMINDACCVEESDRGAGSAALLEQVARP
jgi:hypothetical protein